MRNALLTLLITLPAMTTAANYTIEKKTVDSVEVYILREERRAKLEIQTRNQEGEVKIAGEAVVCLP